MMKSIAVVVAVVSLSQPCVASVQSPSPQATAFAARVDPKIVSKAKEWFYRFQNAEIDRAQLDDAINAELTDEMVRKEASTLKAFGKPSSFKFIRTYAISGTMGYDFLLQFDNGRIVEMIAFDPDGKIAGIDFQTFVRSS